MAEEDFNPGFLEQRRLVLMGMLAAPVLADAARAGAAPLANDTPLYERKFSAFQNKTLEQKVQELADREEIRELIACYAHRVARGLKLDELFTDDGAYIREAPGKTKRVVRGRKALEEFSLHFSPDADNPLPMIHNYLIEISGDEARGLCSNELRIPENGQSIIASGYYDDKYRRENGRWKFVLRHANFFHWVPVQQGWARPVEKK